METLTINERTYKIKFIPFEDKCGLKEDGTYDIAYSGHNIDIQFNDEIFDGKIYEESKYKISFFSNPYPFFGEDIEMIKKYFQEEHGVQEFYFLDIDSDEGYVKF
ncbi:hypothetical protein ACQKOF_22015 [Lysinibacillus sp. NPDC093190]|uniref:hypothetical protein n=1 Tax=Lysinibacillus sp. NPDC093190 TaxID=3390575 RepID=UPI003CFEC941